MPRKRTTIALDSESDRLLSRAARERGVSRSEFIRQHLVPVLEQYRRHPKPRSAGIVRALTERGYERELFGGGRHEWARRNDERDPRDVFTRDLDLPRGREGRPVRERDRVYEINDTESRMLETIGAFRVVSESDLHNLCNDSDGPRWILLDIWNARDWFGRAHSVPTSAPSFWPTGGETSSKPFDTNATTARTSPDRPSTPVLGSHASWTGIRLERFCQGVPSALYNPR